jgi:hypothetical protein
MIGITFELNQANRYEKTDHVYRFAIDFSELVLSVINPIKILARME